MLHKKTIIKLLNKFGFEPIKKIYIERQLERIDNEFISVGVFNALLEDAEFEEKKVYDIDGVHYCEVYYQYTTGKLFERGFREYNPEGYDIVLLHSSDVVLLVPKIINNYNKDKDE